MIKVLLHFTRYLKNRLNPRSTLFNHFPRKHKHCFEILESKCMLSVSSALNGSELSVIGTPLNDDIHLYLSGSDLVVEYTETGITSTKTYNAASISRVNITGLAGNDIIDCGALSITCIISGGQGEDTLIGGNLADTIDAGLDNNIDTITGNGGYDTYASINTNDVIVSNGHNVTGTILLEWINGGSESGIYGLPTSAPYSTTGGITGQRFTGAFAYVKNSGTPYFIKYRFTDGEDRLFSQTYSAVRSDLLEKFFYNGFIAESIYDDNGGKSIKFGDQTKSMGDAMMIFAQEAAILSGNGYDSSQSEYILNILLNAYGQLEGEAELQLYGRNIRGFFVRDYIGKSGDKVQGVDAYDYENIKSDYRNGQTGKDDGSSKYVDPAMSTDQAAHLLSGWWAVTRYSSNSQSISLALRYARDVMSFYMKTHYEMPDIDGVSISSGRGRDARFSSGFISRMVDQITGDNYFYRPDNTIGLGYIDVDEILDKVENAVQKIVDTATASLSQAARRLFNWNPVSDVISQLRRALPSKIDIEIPVNLLHESLLAIADYPYTSLVIELYMNGKISLNQFIPSAIRAVFNRINFDVPTGVKKTGPWYNPKLSLKTKNYNLSDILGSIEFDTPNWFPRPSPYSRDLTLLMMAYDPDPRIDAKLRDASMADTNRDMPGVQPDIWVALIKSAVNGVLPDQSTLDIATRILNQAPSNGPDSNGTNGWSSKNRWETGAAESDGSRYEDYNGIDYMVLETLIKSRGLTSLFNGPPVELLPSADDPTVMDLYVRGSKDKDEVVITASNNNFYNVTISGNNYGLWKPTGKIFVATKEDSDHVLISGRLTNDTRIYLGDMDDQIEIDTSQVAEVIVVGGSGVDSITTDDSSQVWTITGNMAGENDKSTRYNGIEKLTLGSNSDHVNIVGNGKMISIEGNQGQNSIYYNTTAGHAVLLKSVAFYNGYNVTVTDLVESAYNFSHAEAISGDNKDIIVGLDKESVWNINEDYGTYQLLGMTTLFTFVSFETLQGGNAVDDYHVHSLGERMLIKGNAGSDVVAVGDGNIDSIAALLSIQLGIGHDSIYVNDGDHELMANYALGSNYIHSMLDLDAPAFQTQRTFGAIAYTDDVEYIELSATKAPNDFSLYPSLYTEFKLNANNPNTLGVPSRDGDYLDLHTEGTSGRKISFAPPKSGNGQWAFSSGHMRVIFESMERFNHVERLAIGTEAGRYSQPLVKVYDAETLEHLFDILAYESGYRGGVRVATGDIDQDGIPDIITAPGNLHDSIIKVFDGVTELRGGLLTSFNAYPGNFKNGVNIAVGDVIGDNCDDIITVPSLGVADVRVYQTSLGSKLALAKSFNGISKMGYVGGATVAVIDMNNDRKGEILIGSGYGMPSTIIMYGVSSGVSSLGQVTSSNSTLRGGTQVVTTTATPTQPSQLIISSGKKTNSLTRRFVGPLPVLTATRNVNSALDSFFAAFDNTYTNLRAPVHLTSKDYDLDGLVDAIYLSQGTDGKSKKLRVYGPVLRTTSDSLSLPELPWHNGAYIG